MHSVLIHVVVETIRCCASTIATSEAPAIPSQSYTTLSSPTVLSSASYMAIIDKWRDKLGLSALAQDIILEANALETCVEGNGRMSHKLNPGSLAQVLAPGDINLNFEHIFVGGWLCEKPDMRGMDGVCATESSGWSHTSTDHAAILTSANYTKIGCASSSGVTACDLA
jgi:uncharacterized protein YkwD